ncbi:hypothetical protein NDU88_000466 [Pleurodeles waltl]|uniref:Uncharacterized protein n=1 Tax=Pleurodeles waltl TaxID=8319 RepID=A0AAV7LY72_PLEWA|nr:hypothetical protein NDU88_000466 [Pleurodeles waltl]
MYETTSGTSDVIMSTVQSGGPERTPLNVSLDGVHVYINGRQDHIQKVADSARPLRPERINTGAPLSLPERLVKESVAVGVESSIYATDSNDTVIPFPIRLPQYDMWVDAINDRE